MGQLFLIWDDLDTPRQANIAQNVKPSSPRELSYDFGATYVAYCFSPSLTPADLT